MKLNELLISSSSRGLVKRPSNSTKEARFKTMNKLEILPPKLPIDFEIKPDYSSYGPNGEIVKSVRCCLSDYLTEKINRIIANQNEIIDNLEKILKSRIGKAILAFGEDKEE